MKLDRVNQILNQVVRSHSRSLARYLLDATPWWSDKEPDVSSLIQRIVADQRRMIDRIVKLISQQDGVADFGAFPLAFAALHDVSSNYILLQLVNQQRTLVADLESAVEMLDEMKLAKALAQETLGVAKAHLDALQSLQTVPG